MFWRFGIARAEPAGRGDALVERGVDPAVLGMHQRRQRVEVGALELARAGDAASSRAGSGCLAASSSSTSCAVLCSPPGVFWSDGSFSSSKSTWRSCGAELMLNGPPGELVDLVLDRRHPVGELGRELPQPRDVDLHAGRLHPRQDRDQAAARARRRGPRAPRPGPWARGSPRSARWRRRPRRRTRRPGRRRPGPSGAGSSPCRSGR